MPRDRAFGHVRVRQLQEHQQPEALGSAPRGCWNVGVARLGPKMTHVACDAARMLQHVDIVLLQELGPWDNPLSDAHWAAFLKATVGKKADEWDARKNGHCAVLARRKDPRGGCGSYATKLFPWLEAPS